MQKLKLSPTLGEQSQTVMRKKGEKKSKCSINKDVKSWKIKVAKLREKVGILRENV